MTVTRQDPQTIVLAGACPVECRTAAEMPGNACCCGDWRPCVSLHTAVVQVILAAAPALPTMRRFLIENGSRRNPGAGAGEVETESDSPNGARRDDRPIYGRRFPACIRKFHSRDSMN